ncbi:MAG: hypothetical protein AB8H03_21030 [Saprospiraceae bacterium]
MEDEILDYNWVISKEVPIKKEEATLFQKYFNEDLLILAGTMLHDNNIEYHIEIDNPENKKFGILLHKLHVNENDLIRANELLELLINEDEKYPIKRYVGFDLLLLNQLLRTNENVYVDTLLRMELKRRGVDLASSKEKIEKLKDKRIKPQESPIKEEEAIIFQEYFNEDSMILTIAMLHDNNIKYHIKVNNTENKNFGNLLHEIHINQNELEHANNLLKLLVNEDEKYPIKKYNNHSISSLKSLLEENENIYDNTLVKMELKRRGVELDPPEEEARDFVSIVVFISILFLIFLGYQFLKELASF